MSTIGQFSAKNPTIKRILKEASELSNSPSPDYAAAPLESNLFEWHFTIRGPPAPSPFDGGVYHGRIILPPAYPLRPPSFRFLTPSGRFEVNREICLSISGFHEETWQPAWGIRTAIIAIRSFMDTDAQGQMGGLSQPDGTRRKLAKESVAWRCNGCTGKTCAEMISDAEEACRAAGVDASKVDETVPDELRLGYRDEIEKNPEAGPAGSASATAAAAAVIAAQAPSPIATIEIAGASPGPLPGSSRPSTANRAPSSHLQVPSLVSSQPGVTSSSLSSRGGQTSSSTQSIRRITRNGMQTQSATAPAIAGQPSQADSERTIRYIDRAIGIVVGGLLFYVLRYLAAAWSRN